MWLFCLSAQLRIVALVGRYLTNKLMRYRPLLKCSFRGTLKIKPCDSIYYPVLSVVSNCYPRLEGKLPTYYSPVRHWCTSTPVWLACIRHAASVYPEPGSNSQKSFILLHLFYLVFKDLVLLMSFRHKRELLYYNRKSMSSIFWKYFCFFTNNTLFPPDIFNIILQIEKKVKHFFNFFIYVIYRKIKHKKSAYSEE